MMQDITKIQLKQPLLANEHNEKHLKDTEQDIRCCSSVKTIAHLGYPMVIAQIFPPLTSTITHVVLGHEVDSVVLAGFSLGSLTISILGLTIS